MLEAKKELPLIKRLESLESNVTLFVRNFDVPFDNNEAERAIRCVRIKTKSAGCFRGKSLLAPGAFQFSSGFSSGNLSVSMLYIT